VPEQKRKTSKAKISGSGAIAQDGSVAAGAGGIAIGGDVQGAIIVGGPLPGIAPSPSAPPDPDRAGPDLRERLQQQQRLLAAYRRQAVLAGGREAAALAVLIEQAESEIRRLQAEIDDRQG